VQACLFFQRHYRKEPPTGICGFDLSYPMYSWGRPPRTLFLGLRRRPLLVVTGLALGSTEQHEAASNSLEPVATMSQMTTLPVHKPGHLSSLFLPQLILDVSFPQAIPRVIRAPPLTLADNPPKAPAINCGYPANLHAVTPIAPLRLAGVH
jgi:hypothetical protein